MTQRKPTRWSALAAQLRLRLATAARRNQLEGFLPDLGVDPCRPTVFRDLATASRDTVHGTASSSAPIVPVDERPKLSAVLGSYNRLELLKFAISSLRRELSGTRHEIIVVDGGSSDGTLPWLAEQTDIVTIIQHNRYVLNGEARRRMSWGRFMNIGFKASAGEYVIMVSDDCFLLPGSVAHALERIADAQRKGVRVGACAFYFRDWPQDERYFVQRTLGGNLMLNHGIYLREALERLGYCEEDQFVFYKADSDLSLRIWEAGLAIIDSKDSICEHFVGPDSSDPVRASNNQTLEHDRSALHRRWPYMTTKSAVSKMGRIYLDREPDQTVEEIWGALTSD